MVNMKPTFDGLRRWTARILLVSGLVLGATGLTFRPAKAAQEKEYYRLVTITTSQALTGSRAKKWKPPPRELVLEVSGLAVLDRQRLAVAIRKGEVWILGNVYQEPPSQVTYHRFANALHEPLGLLRRGDALLTAQRSEVTQLRDIDGDQVADEYLTVAKGWGVTGNYHEYAFGPKVDGAGNLWITLNLGLGLKPDQRNRTIRNAQLGVAQGKWRGWGLKINSAGKLIPVCAGMRSPSGLGANAAGDMFYTDQQGNWVGTNALHHMREGAFFHHPEALASMQLPDSPIRDIRQIPAGLSFPEAVQRLPQLKPPAVWFPYRKVGQSPTDIVLDDTGGKFGPFNGQLFIGEFTLSSISRVFLEKVRGEYQGACFPFREGFASAVLRMAFGSDGSMFAGLSNRGWSSLGTASYGLQRIVWTGRQPFEIQEMRALKDGFELLFTKPVSASSASDATRYRMQSYTYRYHPQYGSDEILRRQLTIQSATVDGERRRVRLRVDGLRELFVHELHVEGLQSDEGDMLLHPRAYYTLNRIP